MQRNNQQTSNQMFGEVPVLDQVDCDDSVNLTETLRCMLHDGGATHDGELVGQVSLSPDQGVICGGMYNE